MVSVIISGVVSILFFVLSLVFGSLSAKQRKMGANDGSRYAILQWTFVLLCVIALIITGSEWARTLYA